MADIIESSKTGADSPNQPSDTKKDNHLTFHLYDPEVLTSVFKGFSLSPCQLNTEIFDSVETPIDIAISRPETEVPTISTKKTCLLCSCNFTSRQQQSDHFKLDWHRFNLKQRMMGAQVVTQEEFERISGDVSSISGSDSSTDDDSDGDSDPSPYSNTSSLSPGSTNQSDKREASAHYVKGRNHPKVFFRNGDGQLVSVLRCTLHGKKNAPPTQQQLVTMATQLPMKTKWLILMIGGGHFAGAIFDGKEVVAHKTFHRYTVRAKRGTAQGMRDSQQGGNQPKSAGASLRRYNEAALVTDVHLLLASWDDEIKACHRIFMRAPSYNKNAFFGGKSPPLNRRDEKIVTIPFATRRPTFKEIKRVHNLLSTVECHGDADEAEKRIMGLHIPKESQHVNNAVVSSKKENAPVPTESGGISKEVNSDDSADGESDIDLVMVEEEVSTLDLREFATSEKRSKRPKKKRKPKKKPENDDEQAVPSEITNALCSACKDGNWEQLMSLLADFANIEPRATENATALRNCEKTGSETPDKTKISSDDSSETNTSKSLPAMDVTSVSNDTVESSCEKDTISNGLHFNPKSEDITPEVEASDGSTPVELQGIMGKKMDISTVVNFPVDMDGNTLLHIAIMAEQATMLWNLMQEGADPVIKNKKGQLPYVLCNNKELRKEFRRYMAAYPDKYDYERAQIPSPLTADKEEMKSSKMAEKRRLQKKNKRIREKEQKEEQRRQDEERKKQEAEEEERRRFASLSDREKRALAAERRLQAQLAAQGTSGGETIVNTRRCWLCGASLVGKVPFEYLDYKFCSIPCVKQHKQQHKSSTTS